MKVYEYGLENEKTMLMFQPSVEPSWIMFPAAEVMSRDFHVYLAAAEGHNPEEPGTFTTVEKYAGDAVRYLKERGVTQLDTLYGISMGGSTAMYLLAAQLIPVKKAVIDGGVTPYSYPLVIRKLIALRDLAFIRLTTKHESIARIIMPPERWTPAGEDPDEFYHRLFSFLSGPDYTAKTIYNTAWSTNNWSFSEPLPKIDTEIEFWYGDEEKKERREHIAWAQKHFPQLKQVEFKDTAHAEMVLVQPERFYKEAMRFFGD